MLAGKFLFQFCFAMRLLSWNCQGAGKALTARALKALVSENSPDIVFLSETKSDVKKIEKIRLSLNFVDCLCVEAFGKAGGLALFWRKGVELEVVYSDNQIIAALIYSDPPDSTWLLLTIRGPHEQRFRKRFWALMKDLI